MSQHFLLSSRARTLTLASVTRMSDEEVERVFIRLRWQDNSGDPYCPHCGCTIVYACRGLAALRAGTAKPAKRISRSRAGRCLLSIRCRSEPTCSSTAAGALLLPHAPCFPLHAGTGSLRTRRWSEPDSNSRSHLRRYRCEAQE
jgi:hypothetical protein